MIRNTMKCMLASSCELRIGTELLVPGFYLTCQPGYHNSDGIAYPASCCSRLDGSLPIATPAKRSRSRTPVTHGSGKARTNISDDPPGSAIDVVTLTSGLELENR